MPRILHLRSLCPPHVLNQGNCDHSTPLLLESRWLADSPHDSWGVIAWLWESLYTAPGKWTGRKSRWENSRLCFHNLVPAFKVLEFVFFRVVSANLDLDSTLSSKLTTVLFSYFVSFIYTIWLYKSKWTSLNSYYQWVNSECEFITWPQIMQLFRPWVLFVKLSYVLHSLMIQIGIYLFPMVVLYINITSSYIHIYART